MFWNKKEETKSLPDLPPLKSPFSKELSPGNEPEADLSEPLSNPPEEKNILPSFPDFPSDKGFPQAAIKEAIEEENIPQKMQGQLTFKNEEVNEKIIEEHSESEQNPYLTSIRSDLQNQGKMTEQTTSYERSQNDFLPSTKPSIASNPFLKASQNKVQGIELSPQPRILTPPPEYIQTTRFENNEQSTFQKNSASQKSSDIYVKIDKFYSAKKALISIKQDVEQIDDLLKKVREAKIKEERELANWEKQISSVKTRVQEINVSLFEKTS